MLRKGYVLLRRVFLFKHFTPIPRPKWPGGAGALTHPLPNLLPSFRAPPPPRGPSRPPTPKLPEAARRGRCPCNPSGLPGGAAGRSGDHRRRSQPLARAADWEVSPEGGRRRGAGDPGERGSQALNPPEGCRSKTLARRQRRCGWGLGGLALAAAYPPELRTGAPRPRTPGCQPRGRGLSLRGEVRKPAGKSPQRPHMPSKTSSSPGTEERMCEPSTPPRSLPHPREQNSRIPVT